MKQATSRILSKLGIVAAIGLPLGILAGCNLGVLFPVANQHDANWLKDHGPAVQAVGGAEVATLSSGIACVQCHTTKATAGKVAASAGANSTCFTCHSSGASGSPHDSEWLTRHGREILDVGGLLQATISNSALSLKDETCEACHAVALLPNGASPSAGPKATTTCFTCHNGPDGSPHATTWAGTTNAHADFVIQAGGYAKAMLGDKSCDACHAVASAAATSPAAKATCWECHQGPAPNPHTQSTWYNAAQPFYDKNIHAKWVNDKGGPALAYLTIAGKNYTCTTCHSATGSVSTTGLAQKACDTCHGTSANVLNW